MRVVTYGGKTMSLIEAWKFFKQKAYAKARVLWKHTGFGKKALAARDEIRRDALGYDGIILDSAELILMYRQAQRESLLV